MTEEQFRCMHSELIEWYQCLEFHLRALLVVVDPENGGRFFHERLEDFPYSLGQLVQMLRKLQDRERVELLSSEDFQSLEELRKSRVYWTHQCFVDCRQPHVWFRKGVIRHPHHAERLLRDLDDAEDWNRKITEVTRSFERAKRLI